MLEDSSRKFGLLIAYIVPGFVALWGASYMNQDLRLWLLGPASEGPTLGGFLYVTVASVSGGMLANAVRWAFLDSLHHATGLVRPRWRDTYLHERVAAYEWIVENHYRHYQFYGNTLVSLIIGYLFWRASLAGAGTGVGWVDTAIVALSLVLVAGSRTTLSRYYRRTESLLGAEHQGEQIMANGGHPKPPKSETKPQEKKSEKPKSAKPANK